MYIKIPKGTPLFDTLYSLADTWHEYNQTAFKWATEFGATRIRPGYWNMAGGLSVATFPTKAPRGWVKAGRKYEDDEYRPSNTLSGRDIAKAIEGLPKMTYDEFNKIIRYDPYKHEGDRITFHPAINWKKDFVLLEFPDHTPYKPISGMEEITVSEYRKLIAAPNPKRSVATDS